MHLQVTSQITSLITYSILEILVPNELEVLLYGFGGQSVLTENKMLAIHEPVDLRHCHVG